MRHPCRILLVEPVAAAVVSAAERRK